ncbi:MAG: FtsW/RodA/SpoVE family cell cycle protein [Acidobacteriota bacterium]
MAYKLGSDKILFGTAGFLTIFGLLMVYNASSVVASSEHGMSFYVFLRQLAYAGIGFGCLIRLMNIDYHKWLEPRYLYTALVLCAIALIFVLTQPTINGARRWVRIGGLLSFQPSEGAKLAVIVFIAAFLHFYEDKVKYPNRHLFMLFAVVGFFAGLIVIEPDLGQAICICFIAAIMLYVAGLSWKYYASALILAIPCFYIFVVSEPFRWARIMAFLDPYKDPTGTGWHIIQSLTAVGSGGLTFSGA